MSRKLVAYFSASGVTARLAKILADATSREEEAFLKKVQGERGR